jgi:hypothetical protein
VTGIPFREAFRRPKHDRQDECEDLLGEHDDVEGPDEISEREAPRGAISDLAKQAGEADAAAEDDRRDELSTPPRGWTDDRGRKCSDEQDVDQSHQSVEQPGAGLGQNMRVTEARGTVRTDDRRQTGRKRTASASRATRPSGPVR